jgi:hypothetical protein
MFTRLSILTLSLLCLFAPHFVEAQSIAGIVSSAATNLPIENANVYLLDASSKAIIGATSTAADGNYFLGNLAPGDYGVCVLDSTDDYIDGCYDGMAVGADGIVNFTTIALASGQDLQDINLNLQLGATLSGTLSDAYFNVPIANLAVDFTLYSSAQNQVASIYTSTDANGGFTLHGLATGSYYLEAGVDFVNIPNSAYPPRLFDSGSCVPQCPFATGTLIDVPPSGTTGITFPLSPGYFVSGTVTDEQTGLGIPNVTINTCDNPSAFLFSVSATAVTDANGNYLIAHAANEQTHIATIDAPDCVNVTWPNAIMPPSYSCWDSGIFGGDTLTFTNPDQVLTGVNFTLQRGAAVSGAVTASDAPGQPISAKVALFDNNGQLIGVVNNAADGSFTTVGVAPGTYYVAAFLDDGDDCQVYAATNCGFNWAGNASSIDPFGGTPIVLAGTQIQTGINLQLKSIPDRIFSGAFDYVVNTR